MCFKEMNIRQFSSKFILSIIAGVVLFCGFFVLPQEAESQVLEDRLSERYLERNDFEGAVGFLEKYVESNSDDPEALLQLGISYMRVGRHLEAIDVIERSIELDPESAFSYAWLARAKAELGISREAGELLDEALSLDPDDVRLQVFAGGVLFELGDFEAADDIAYSLAGDDLFYTSPDGAEILLLIFTAIEIDGIEAAEEIIDEVSKQVNKPGSCLNVYFADIYIGMGVDYYDRAWEMLEDVEPGCNFHGTVSFRLGYIAGREGDSETAISYYSEAYDNIEIGLPPSRGGALSGLMMINAMRNNGEDPDLILNRLEDVENIYEDYPYYYWLLSLVYDSVDDRETAGDFYLEAAKMLPLNFSKEPGPYSIFSRNDFETLNDISASAGDRLEYFELHCNIDFPISTGTFFTTEAAPGLENLYRFIGEGDSAGLCGFEVYASKAETTGKVKDQSIKIIPLEFSEDVYFLKYVYPSSALLEKLWYVPITSVFPLLLEE